MHIPTEMSALKQRDCECVRVREMRTTRESEIERERGENSVLEWNERKKKNSLQKVLSI